MQEEALGRDLDDVAGAGAGQRRLEHRLMDRGIEAVADLRRDDLDAMLAEDAQDFAHGQVDAFDKGSVLGAGRR